MKHLGTMKAKSIRFLNFLTHNFIPEENKREMDIQNTYIKYTTQFLGLMNSGILAKLHPIIWCCISVWVFSCKFLQYFENTFF